MAITQRQFEIDRSPDHRIVYGSLLIATYQSTAECPPHDNVRDQAFEVLVRTDTDQVDPIDSMIVRSKNEVIITGLLDYLAPGSWA